MATLHSSKSLNSKLYRQANNFSASKKPQIIAYMWGFLEGTVFFIVPDFFIGFIALFHRKNSIWSVMTSILGSLTSAVTMYLLVSSFGTKLNVLLENIPGVSTTLIAKVFSNLEENGLRSLVSAPFEGIPYKIYSVQAAFQQMPLIQFLLWSIPARLERILPGVFLVIVVGYIFRKSIRKHTVLWILSYFGVWIIIYIAYFMKFGF